MGGFRLITDRADGKSFLLVEGEKQMKINKLKFAKVYVKTKGKCAYCGEELKEGEITIDHIQPKSKGGCNNADNLFLCCKSCNSRKKNRTLKEFRFYASLDAYEMPHFKYEQFLYLKNKIKDFEGQFFPQGQLLFYYETIGE